MITAFAEHLGISLAGLTEDGGEQFITYEVLFSVGLLRTDYFGQGYFLQVEGDQFHVPVPQLTKVDVRANQANWKLNIPAHRRAIEANPINGVFRKKNIPSRIPVFEPRMTPPMMQSTTIMKKRSIHMQKEVECHHRRRPNIIMKDKMRK